jgi:ABC-type transport system involved in multi-copper enzyme maturation permease subunit
MVARILAVALNAYREAVRNWILAGLLGLALATSAYSMVVGTLSLHQETRVVADLGSASISLYAVLVAIVLGATSLYRELEQKTIFPILTRRLRRHEYLVGKYLGALATLAVFVAIDGGLVLGLLAIEAAPVNDTGPAARFGVTALAFLCVLAALLWRFKFARVQVLVPWSLVFFVVMALECGAAADDRRMVVASALLTLSEVAIVSAVATLFASFSSPFLTALFTLGIFLAGRSADAMAHLPARLFGSEVHAAGAFLGRVLPNLGVYVPSRVLLLGQDPSTPVWPFVGLAALHAAFYAAFLLTLSALIFRRRDFE